MTPSTRPIIGITTYVEPASWAVWRDVPAALLPYAYVRQVADAGGLPLLIPPLPSDATPEDVREVLGRLDGLILSGGADVEPERYGAAPHPSVQAPRRDRDGSELELARESGPAGVPVLGVCRGMQVMAVAAGGTLDQHTPDLVGHEEHSPGGDEFGSISVSTTESSALGSILGPAVSVHCHHHQSVRSHPGYEAVAHADDGTLEAMEAEGNRFCLAVQWHPEMGRDQRLFDALVKAAGGG
jgi:putative glutamine amidotransferase